MASVNRESIGNLHEKLTVKLEKSDYLPAFEKEVRSFSKKANIPGFRKGMVPAGMIRKMYGKELFTDVVTKAAENELRTFLIEEKADIFGQPLFLNDEENLPKIEMNDPQDYEFTFEIGLRPEVKVDIPDDAAVTFYKVQVKPEDIEQRIDSFQSQFGELQEAESVASPEHIVFITIAETDDEGNVKEDGFADDTSLYVKVFTEEFQKELQGKKKDDVLTGKLHAILDPEKFPAVYEKMKLDPKNAEEAASPVQIRITAVNTLDKAPLDEELYKKAFPSKEITTEEAFRQAVAEDEQKYWDDAASNYLQHELHHILTDIPVSLPDEFLKKMINDPEHPETDEEIDARYPAFAKQLSWSLISDKIVQDHKLEVSREELREDIGNEIKQYLGGASPAGDDGWIDSYIDRVMEDKKQIEQRYDKLLGTKIFDWARTAVPVQEKEVSQEEFSKIVKEHNEQHSEEHQH